MSLKYNFNIKNGMFKYNCLEHDSYIEIRAKDIKKLYDVLNRLDALEKRAEKDGTGNCLCNEFEIIFNFSGCVRIKNFSNWLSIEGEVPIIKGELSKYIKEYYKDNVKDIIIKIKSLNKGSSNIIKEDLK